MTWTLYIIGSYLFLGFITVGMLADYSLKNEDSGLRKAFKRSPIGTIIGLLLAMLAWPLILLSHKNI